MAQKPGKPGNQFESYDQSHMRAVGEACRSFQGYSVTIKVYLLAWGSIHNHIGAMHDIYTVRSADN